MTLKTGLIAQEPAPWLRALGLDERTAFIYLRLVGLGEQPVSVIARRLGLKRTTMYYILESLVTRGVIQQRTRDGIRYFKACAPARLLAALRWHREQLAVGEKEMRAWCRGKIR